MKKILLFDFDGVIHSYISKWQGHNIIPDEPVEGIKETIDKLKEEYQIYIYSSRCEYDSGIQAIEEWCDKYNIYYDEVCNRKPPAYLTIDDRAICFNGNCGKLLDDIKDFQVWNR